MISSLTCLALPLSVIASMRTADKADPGVATASSTEITTDATGLSGDHVADSAAARGVDFRRRLLAAAKGMRSITPYLERGKVRRRGWAGNWP
jgi:hypothetical protein